MCVKYFSKMWHLWKRWLWKLKFCTEVNQTLLFRRLQNNFFHSRPLQGANISQISSFTRTTEPYNIKLVPNIWNTSFNQPAEISIDSSADVALIQLVPKYQKWKLKPIILFWNNCPHENWGKWANFSTALHRMGIHTLSGLVADSLKNDFESWWI